MKYEAIILCGGEGWRLKPDTWIPKPLLKISKKETLLDRQVRWLLENDFTNIVLAANKSFPESVFFTNPNVQPCIERRKLGTGGAVKRAINLTNVEQIYVMNVDDIVFYNPKELFEYSNKGAALLLAQPQLPFGKATLQGNIVTKFEHKSTLNIWVNAGHYVFSRQIVKEYFPDKGDLEQETMQKLAKSKLLLGLKYSGEWLTLNTMKDLVRIRKYLNNKQ